ncbi:hypothetical protein GUA34_04430 [Streptococcus pyogenes]|uniref:SLC13 family permease n=1 Tax=Streptococcus pyogenes TaxID=1314 RepID=UPI00136D3DBA|nr:hypothetical protein [Streptococcus pyogenes]MZX83009.1 hypothetical protein [Streptococcus pyogenes]HEQ5429027.1 hypothetical protein [Streptococcus pyogenes]HER1650117.1 hypothetical protein [Streptococcus pyogenes]HER8994652.1 hypothetical protein [Streptococcus pyogenes]
MLLTMLAYAMIIVFMYVVMKKKMPPFTALVMIPLIMTIAVILTGSADFNADAKFVAFVGDGGIAKDLTAIGPMVMYGINNTAKTGIMLLFAILFFSVMLDAGLFDPITEKMIRFAKGDPMKVLIATAVVAAAVSLNGDGTTTTLICCSAFLPIYKKLDMKIMNLGVLIILQNTIMNLLPWGGPTARAMSVLGVGPEILGYLAEAGAEYGFSNMAMALASLMGQAFHLLSPLVAFIYLLLRLTGLDMGEWQKEAAKYALIIFVIFVVTIIAMGQMPLYIPQ